MTLMKQSVTQLKPYIPEVPLSKLQAELGVAEIVRMSANENPFGTTPAVAKAVRNWNFDDAHYYPDGDAGQLRQVIAAYHGVQPAQLLFGCGLDEIIELTTRTFLTPGDEVVEPWPTFGEYKIHAEIEGAKTVDVPVRADGVADLDGLIAAITSKTKLLWLCNPNNPTGTFVGPDALADFLRRVPEHVLVLVDEAYIDFVADSEQNSALQFLNIRKNLMVMRTFSKAYGIANFRVGYAVVPTALAPAMQAVRLPYNLNDVSQTAALAAFGDREFIDQTRARVQAARTQWTEFLTKQGLPYYESAANFIFFSAPKADDLAQFLKQHGFLVRSGLQPDWLRVTLGTKEQNTRVMELIAEFYE